MSDSFIKRVEIGFRRFLIRVLSQIVHRKTPVQPHLDYMGCKFLFVRQDLIGDVLISTPLFSVLKSKYPSAIVDVLLSKNNHFVLANDPLVRKRWIYKKNIIATVNMLKEIRFEKYDFVLDLMDNPSVTSTIFCLLSGARWTVGIHKENSFAYDILVPMLSRRDTHILDRIVRLLEPFGIDVAGQKLALRYFTSVESRNDVDKFFSNNNLHGREIIGINISAGSDVRFWGIHNYREFIQKLINNYPNSVPVILYKPSHKNNADKIINNIEECVLSPVTESFDQFAAYVQRCSFLVTPDTSAVHLASAFGIPTIVLYIQSNKELRIWEPYAVDYEALIADDDNLALIPVEDVYMAFCALYKRTQGKYNKIA